MRPRHFRRRKLMQQVKAGHRRLVRARTNTTQAIRPRATAKFRVLWALMQGRGLDV